MGDKPAKTERPMPDIVRMSLAEPILYGVLKIQWQEGYAGIVDLRGIFEEGDMFAFNAPRA